MICAAGDGIGEVEPVAELAGFPGEERPRGLMLGGREQAGEEVGIVVCVVAEIVIRKGFLGRYGLSALLMPRKPGDGAVLELALDARRPADRAAARGVERHVLGPEGCARER